MDTVRIRRITPDDLDGITAVCRLSLPFDPITRDLVLEKTYHDPYFAPHASFVAVAGGRLVGCAPVSCLAREERTGYVKILAVHPHHRRRGIGRQLLTAVEQTLGADGATAVRILDEPANYLAPGVDVRYTAAHCFLPQCGYTRTGERVNMRVDLLALPYDTAARAAGLQNQGIVIRRATATDEPDLMAFLAQHWTSWQYEVGNTFRNMPITTFIALDMTRQRSGRIVAFASYEGNNRGTGWFGPMGTDPDYRRRGIGEVCCLRCLENLRELGHRTATIPWVGPIAFYARICGAEIDRVFWAYEKRLASVPAPPTP